LHKFSLPAGSIGKTAKCLKQIDPLTGYDRRQQNIYKILLVSGDKSARTWL
jgi:hypothetical protein